MYLTIDNRRERKKERKESMIQTGLKDKEKPGRVETIY